ncbi:MAG: hypothetical protein R2911_32480 [Caldilineaceae bacterium]
MLYYLGQRFVVQGLAAGAVKGVSDLRFGMYNLRISSVENSRCGGLDLSSIPASL